MLLGNLYPITEISSTTIRLWKITDIIKELRSTKEAPLLGVVEPYKWAATRKQLVQPFCGSRQSSVAVLFCIWTSSRMYGITLMKEKYMQTQQANQSTQKKLGWFKKPWGIILIILSAIFVLIPMMLLFIAVGVVMLAADPRDTTQQKTNPTTNHATENSKIPYEGVEIWKIGDNGLGTTIVIDDKYDNAESLKQLGSELNKENETRQFAMNYVYTDKTSALYRSESFCSPEQPSSIRAHKQNWAAFYHKDNSGARLTIFNDRSCSPDAQTEVIQY